MKKIDGKFLANGRIGSLVNGKENDDAVNVSQLNVQTARIDAIVLNGIYPLTYKALISQNAPIATTTDPTMVAGQIWVLEAYNTADASTIASLELISGVLYDVGSKYRSATDQTLNVNVATTLSYDGAPYVVSTNSAGDFAPFVNTLGGTTTYSYNGAGDFLLNGTGLFSTKNKVAIKLINAAGNFSLTSVYWNDTNSVGILTSATGAPTTDNDLFFASFEIEVYE
mgnify:CR=1 FL=1